MLLFITFFMFALDSFHFRQKIFHPLIVFALVLPVVFLSELKEILDVGLCFAIE